MSNTATAAATPALPNVAAVETPAIAAVTPARDTLPAPEATQALAPEAAAVAAEGAVVPPQAPEVKVKLPPIHVVNVAPGAAANDAQMTPVADGHDNKAAQMEQMLKGFVEHYLPKESQVGMMIDVKLANSNAVTSHGEQGLHDLAITFTGGKLEDPQEAKAVAQQLQAALRNHPAFADMSFGGDHKNIEHFMRCEILSLDAQTINSLLTATPPAKPTTFLGTTQVAPAGAQAANDAHLCSGASCAHHIAAQAATVLKEIPTEVTPPEIKEPKIEKPVIGPPKDAADAAKVAEQPKPPVVQPTPPVTPTVPTQPQPPRPDAVLAEPGMQVVAPAALQGKVAANAPTVEMRAQ